MMKPDPSQGDSTERVRRVPLDSLLLPAVMAAQLGLLLFLAHRDFVVIDELAHIPAGISHWSTGTFHLYCVNPPLVRSLAALPVLAVHPEVDYQNLVPPVGKRGEWQFARDFAKANQGRYVDLVRLARLPMIAWCVLGTWVIFRWSNNLYGRPAGLVASTIWAFDPTVLSFGHVVIPDVPSAVAALAATYTFWLYLKRPSWGLAVAAGFLLGIAELTKFTLLILYAVWPLLWLIATPWRSSGSSGMRRSIRGLAAHGALIAVLSLLVVNAGYAFRDTCLPIGSYEFVSRTLGSPGNDPTLDGGRRGFVTGNIFRGSMLQQLPVPLPADLLKGVDFQRLDFESQMPSYMRGEWRTEGWWEYYVYALAVKEPIGTWLLALWSLGLVVLRHPASAPWKDEICLLLPAIVILAFVSSQTGFNHHMRYVLPMFPFIAVGIGKLAWYVKGTTRAPALLVLVALGGSIASTLSVYPHTMSYFNEIAGGPENGPRHLADSNIDWGQDVLYLKDWLDAHPEARPVGLLINHLVDPAVVGIDFHIPPEGRPVEIPSDAELDAGFGPWPGYYAVSTSILCGTKAWIPDGDWGVIPINRHGQYSYFHEFEPVARSGFSIYIYNITLDQANYVRKRLGMHPLPAGYVDRHRRSRPPSYGVAGRRAI